MRLIYMTACCLNPSKFRKFTRFVILTQIKSNGPMILGCNSPTISHVNNVQVIIEGHYEVAARTRLTVLHLLSCLVLGEDAVDVVLICHVCTPLYRCSNILRELLLKNNVVMQVLLQVLSTLVSTMTIVNSKYLDFGPHII